METSPRQNEPPFWISPKISGKMGASATNSGASWILRTDSNSATTKTPTTAVSSNSNEFHKLTQKNDLTIVKEIFEDLDFYKIFKKVQHPYVKFDQKQNGDVPGPYDPPFTSYAKISCKKNVRYT